MMGNQAPGKTLGLFLFLVQKYMMIPIDPNTMIPPQIQVVRRVSEYRENAYAFPSSARDCAIVELKSVEPRARSQWTIAAPYQNPPVAHGDLIPTSATTSARIERVMTSAIHPDRMAGRSKRSMLVSAHPVI